MKKWFLIIVSFSSLAFSQQEYQGRALYIFKEIVNIDEFAQKEKISRQQAEKIVERSKHLLEKKFTLTFNKSISLYKQSSMISQPFKNNRQSNSKTINNYDVLYKSIKEKVSYESTELMGKRFLVYEDMQKFDWELTNETRKLNNYTIHKATMFMKNDESKDILVTAWYASEIPVSHGPSKYWGLPGLILQLSYENYVFLCSEIVINPSKRIKIKKPEKGEKIERKDFVKLRWKKFLEYTKG